MRRNYVTDAAGAFLWFGGAIHANFGRGLPEKLRAAVFAVRSVLRSWQGSRVLICSGTLGC